MEDFAAQKWNICVKLIGLSFIVVAAVDWDLYC